MLSLLPSCGDLHLVQVSVFAEYQHFWWADATFNTPAASPAFNYNPSAARTICSR
jgi:hypothetical protein